MAFMEPLVPAPKSDEDYKDSIFLVDTRKKHEIDQINLHKQIGELIF